MTGLNIQTNVPLLDRNTFGFACRAAELAETGDDEQLEEALLHAESKRLPVLVLGGGSNLVFTGDWPGLVLCPRGQRLRFEPLDTDRVHLAAEAGVVWDDLVRKTASMGYRGIENLALIPGLVGAAPVQNIGAYGVELESCLVSVRAFHRPAREWLELDQSECAFAYRDSLFKQRPDDFVITRITLELDRNRPLELGYRPLAEAAAKCPEPLTANDVVELVSSIRRSKLPDPAVIGNAGSFFKNPVVTRDHFVGLKQRYPDLVGFELPDGHVKLSAGWMIEKLGFKGIQRGPVGVHEQQALVLTHRGGGKPDDLLGLANDIQETVEERFEVQLEREPRLTAQTQ